jgi:hypothetical protein
VVTAPKPATVETVDELLARALELRRTAGVRPDLWWPHVNKLLDRRNELTARGVAGAAAR